MFKSKKKLYKIRYKTFYSYIYRDGYIYEAIVSAKNVDKALKIFHKAQSSKVDIVSVEEFVEKVEVQRYCQ